MPHTTSSLSLGTGTSDPVDVMRLDPKGQTPHVSGVDEMKVDYLKRLYGLITTITWDAQNAEGTVLFSLDASPCFSIEKYCKVVNEGVDCYSLPPVAVLANLYAEWRGSIEFRMDFICTRFHVGKIWVSFQPNVEGAMTYAQARACTGIEIDLSESNRRHTFVVPFVSDRPFWPRLYPSGVKADVQRAPGLFVAYVMAPLTCTETVPSTIDCNLYVRGGEDLEFAVPCQPAIGLSYNPRVPSKPGKHEARSWNQQSYAPAYAGVWHNYFDSTGLILRWGTLSDRLTEFTGFEQGYIYTISKDQRSGEWLNWLYKRKDGQMIPLINSYFVPFNDGDGNGLIYCGVFASKEDAKSVWLTSAGEYNWIDPNNHKKGIKANYDKRIQVADTTDNTWSPSDASGNGIIIILEGVPASGTPPSSLCDSDFEEIGFGESDARSDTGVKVELQDEAAIEATDFYGERFMDLKDLCRRYQPYFQWSEVVPREFGSVAAVIPAVPTGLALDEHKPFLGLCRDGIIPIVASGFRYYRGGLRFKILANWLNPSTIWMQVRPDRRFRGRRANLEPMTQLDSMFNQGYATSVQATSVNPTLTVEVPFYQPGEYGLLQMTDETIGSDQASWSISNGEMVIGMVQPPIFNQDKIQATLVVLYSIADDCRFSVFQGFPAMIPLADNLPK